VECVEPRSTVASVAALSPRLKAIVDALPLGPGLRVIEIGCGPGAAAREVADRVGPQGHVLAVDRSAKSIALLTRSAADLIAAKRLTARQVAAEEHELDPEEERYHIAFAVRVGAFDGRDPHAGALALERLGHALVPGGRLFIDGGDPLRVVELPTAR
jgi:SAM-dependent methyltransferase